MSEVTRKRLSRGTKLYKEHFDILRDIETDPKVAASQMATGRGTFRINLNISKLHGGHTNFGEDQPHGIPFILPPLQEYFDVTTGTPNYFEVDESTPRIHLEEVHFSFDQREEAAAVAGPTYNTAAATIPGMPNAASGKLGFEEIGDRYKLALAIVEKTPTFFSSEAGAYVGPQREVWSVEIPPDAFSGKFFRLNPYVLTGIARELHPYKSYMLKIYFEDLYETVGTTRQDFALVNVQVSLVCSHPLVPRDAALPPQNLPTNQAAFGTGFVIAPPAATINVSNGGTPGTKIVAGGETESISQDLYEVDTLWRDKFKAGYDRFAEPHYENSILDDGSYEVICIPLFGNTRHGGVVWDDVAGLPNEPYWSPGGRNMLFDRRIVPLVQPLMIQHVYLAYNMTDLEESVAGGRTSGGFPNASLAGWDMEVGLGLGTGIRSDGIDYTQVASYTWNDFGGVGNFPNQVDILSAEESTTIPFSVSNSNWTIVQMDLVGTGGNGFFAQGPPIFAARGSNHWQRTQCGGVAPPTAAAETFLEARMKYSGLATGTGQNNRVLIGFGGHYMIVIAKKYMAIPRSR